MGLPQRNTRDLMREVIKVVIADYYPLMRVGIAAVLSDKADLLIVGETADVNQAQQLCYELQPDVLVLGLSVVEPSPEATMAYLHRHTPGLKVLVLASCEDDARIRDLVLVGVQGLMLREDSPHMVIHAIHALMQGGTWLSPAVLTSLACCPSFSRVQVSGQLLDEREQQLLELVGEGCDNKQIAERLTLAEQTVRNYVSRLYHKLGVNSRGEAANIARNQRTGAVER